MKYSGHRVIAAAAPGMTATNPPDGKQATFEGAVTPQSLDGILAACGSKTAGSRKEGADAELIEPDGQDKQEHRGIFKNLSHLLQL